MFKKGQKAKKIFSPKKKYKKSAHKKKYAINLKGIQIKAQRYYSRLTKMAIKTTTKIIKKKISWQGCGQLGTLNTLLVGM